MAEHRALTDEEVVAAIRDGVLPADISVADLAHELQRSRKALRQDSRRGEQLRKMRWTIENLLTKVEHLEKDEGPALDAARSIANWLESDRWEAGPEIAAAIMAGEWQT